MHRRHFLSATAAGSALALTGRVFAASSASPAPATTDKKPREFYQLRRYTLQTGPQLALTEGFFTTALIPALTRLGLGPIGAFKLDIGPETPTFYLLVPSTSLETLALLDLTLAQDAAFVAAAQPFWGASAAAPAFLRCEASIHAAFEGWPRLTPPDTKTPRIFQLRTYESPTYAAHIRKVEMFHSGEFEFFGNAGFHPVFFGDTLIGPRQPSLTYMLSFADLAQLTSQWNVFLHDPAWKKLSTSPRFASEPIVSNISNLILSPLAASQI